MTAIFLQHFFVPRPVSPPLPSSYAVQLRFVRTPVLKIIKCNELISISSSVSSEQTVSCNIQQGYHLFYFCYISLLSPSGLKTYYGGRCFLKVGGFINFSNSQSVEQEVTGSNPSWTNTHSTFTDLFLWDVKEPTSLFKKSRGRKPQWCGKPLWVVGLGRDGTLHGT